MRLTTTRVLRSQAQATYRKSLIALGAGALLGCASLSETAPDQAMASDAGSTDKDSTAEPPGRLLPCSDGASPVAAPLHVAPRLLLDADGVVIAWWQAGTEARFPMNTELAAWNGERFAKPFRAPALARAVQLGDDGTLFSASSTSELMITAADCSVDVASIGPFGADLDLAANTRGSAIVAWTEGESFAANLKAARTTANGVSDDPQLVTRVEDEEASPPWSQMLAPLVATDGEGNARLAYADHHHVMLSAANAGEAFDEPAPVFDALEFQLAISEGGSGLLVGRPVSVEDGLQLARFDPNREARTLQSWACDTCEPRIASTNDVGLLLLADFSAIRALVLGADDTIEEVILERSDHIVAHALDTTADGGALALWVTFDRTAEPKQLEFKLARFARDSGWTEPELLYTLELDPYPQDDGYLPGLTVQALDDGRVLAVWERDRDFEQVFMGDFSTSRFRSSDIWSLVAGDGEPVLTRISGAEP